MSPRAAAYLSLSTNANSEAHNKFNSPRDIAV
jgi:hypothetical protein